MFSVWFDVGFLDLWFCSFDLLLVIYVGFLVCMLGGFCLFCGWFVFCLFGVLGFMCVSFVCVFCCCLLRCVLLLLILLWVCVYYFMFLCCDFVVFEFDLWCRHLILWFGVIWYLFAGSGCFAGFLYIYLRWVCFVLV